MTFWEHAGSLLLFSLSWEFHSLEPNHQALDVGWRWWGRKELLSFLLYLVAQSEVCGKEGKLERRLGGKEQKLSLSSQASIQKVNIIKQEFRSAAPWGMGLMVRGSRLQYANATTRWWWLLLGPRGTLRRPLPLQVSVSIVLKGYSCHCHSVKKWY